MNRIVRFGLAAVCLLALPGMAGAAGRTPPPAMAVTHVFLARHAERFATGDDPTGQSDVVVMKSSRMGTTCSQPRNRNA